MAYLLIIFACLTILALIGGYLLGRKYAIIDRTKLIKARRSRDLPPDIVTDIAEAISTPPFRALSPSKKRRERELDTAFSEKL